MARLEILIVTMGKEGISRIASLNHPRVDGVEYIVSWQNADMSSIPRELAERPDFKIYPCPGVGISNNRNNALKRSSADFLLISDDDLEYTEEHIRKILSAFDKNSHEAILTFKYSSSKFPKKYPQREFSLNGRWPRGYYLTSFEIGINLKALRTKGEDEANLRFNPNFGINGNEFISGEEEIFIVGLLRKGHSGRFIPEEITVHKDATTGMRRGSDRAFIETKGACMLYVKPFTWSLRMLTHAFRAHINNNINFFTYCRWWLDGVKKAKLKKVFDE